MTRFYSSLLAFLALAAALFISPEDPDLLSLLLVLTALALALVGCCRRNPGQDTPMTRWVLLIGLGLLGLRQLWFLYVMRTFYPPYAPIPVTTRLLLPLAGLGIMSYTWKGQPKPGWRFPALLGLYFFIGASLLRAWPPPQIDVWWLQMEGSARLLHGQNPYELEFPNPYPDENFYSPRVLKDGKILSFPYPPLSLLLAVPGYLAGDVRWSMLAAITGTGFFLVATGRRLGLPPGHPAELAAAVFLFFPRGWHVLEMAWTEPFSALAMSAGVWAMAGRRRWVSGLALTAALTVKQYGFLWLPSLWISRRFDWRRAIPSFVAAGLLLLVFFAWNPREFWRGVVEFQIYSPFRSDCLSVPAWVYVTTGGYQLPSLVGFAAAGLVFLWILWRSVPGLASALLGGVALFLTLFTFNKAAHLNYYWLALGLLALAIITSAGESLDWPVEIPTEPAGAVDPSRIPS